ncbi:MAG: pilus assembly protein [Sphingobium sp.]|nr:pilus assembly protein [Sphingobium sp.]
MTRLFYRLRRDAKGAATVEFAVISVFFFFVIMGGMDIAMYYIQQSKLGSAVSAGSASAFQNRATVDYTALQTYIRQASRAPAGTTVGVTTSCNGGTTTCANTGRTCACLSQSGSYVSAASCTAACTGTGMTSNSTAGYYLTITASYAYRPVLLPHGFMTGKSVQRTSTIRLQ